MDTTYQIINKLYSKEKGFYQQYGIDLIIAIIIIYIFLTSSTYYYVMNHLPLLRNNWETNKCNPLYIPFAGLIINDNKKSKFETVSDNFTECTQNILTSIASDAFKPIYYIINLIIEAFDEITEAINSVRAMFNNVRGDIHDTAVNISGRTLNVTSPIVENTGYAKDMMGKAHGVLTSSIYTLFGSFITAESFFLFLKDVIAGLLIILAATIIALWILSFVPFVDMVAIPAAWLATAGYMLILLPFVIVIIILSDVFNIATDNVPKGPPKRGSDACFDKNTLIKMKNNKYKKISEIDIGDILFDGSIVTGIMNMSSYNNRVYNFNDIIVTGLHRVYHENLGWVKVKEHTDAFEIKDYRENILYCLNTNTKTIKIKEFTFLDWDDIDDRDKSDILKNCLYMPNYINNEDFHKYLDNGFGENTLIEMDIGTFSKIKDIQVNDLLRFGERVLGVIKIDSKDLDIVYEYELKNKMIIQCTNNIDFISENLGNININNIQGIQVKESDCLYQIITDTGTYHIGDYIVNDYNYVIDKFLQK